MGDRANIAIQQHDESFVYLYGHWSGSEMPLVLQRALQKHWRWDDPAYLTRVIFCELVKGDEGGGTGFGISTGICDNEYPILAVYPENQTVALCKEPACKDGKLGPLVPVKGTARTFEEYCSTDLSGDAWSVLKGKCF
jgi:hypothetical protein